MKKSPRVCALPALCLLPAFAVSLSGCGTRPQPGQSMTSAHSTPPPPINAKSSKQNINAYVRYYQRKGFVVTANTQMYNADGSVSLFQFAASKQSGASSETASATISAATNTVSSSSSAKTSSKTNL